MHGSESFTAELISSIAQELKVSSGSPLNYEVMCCPPAPYLAAAREALVELPFKLGAQTMSAFQEGAHTGEVSLDMLREFACQYVLIGHSERRELYSESDAVIAKKFAACITSNTEIKPVLCVGETLEDRQSGATEKVVAQQLDAVLSLVGINGFKNAVIAYEPVWAIGTGETATPKQAQSVHAFIRKKLSGMNSEIATQLQILYGGSVKPNNAQQLFSEPDIDGGLIGGASLDATDFAGICRVAGQLSSSP
jgi:triosephosphate isomerase